MQQHTHKILTNKINIAYDLKTQESFAQ